MVDRSGPRPRVLHVVHGLWVGGAEVDLVRKLRWLKRELDYPIHVCCLMRKGQLAPLLEAEGGELIGPLMQHRRDMNGVTSLRRLLSRDQWDIVHSHMYEGSFVTGVAMATVFPARRPRWIVSEHAMADYWDTFQLILLRHFARQAFRFVVPTRTASQSFVERGFPPDRMRVIPNGVHLEMPAASARARIRAALGLSDEDRLLGTVCRLHRIKGLPLLMEAVSTLPVRLVIAGDGPARPELEALITSRGWSERVQLLGTRTDVPDLLAALDVFVLPSLSESMSIAVAEALLAGVPVVATRAGGIPEITGDGSFARLVPPEDVAALRAAIRESLLDLPAARRAALAGRAWVEEHLSVAASAQQLHELYLESRAR